MRGGSGQRPRALTNAVLAPREVTAYLVYLSDSPEGSARSQLQTPVPVGTNEFAMLPDTPMGPYSHLVVYARSRLRIAPAARARMSRWVGGRGGGRAVHSCPHLLPPRISDFLSCPDQRHPRMWMRDTVWRQPRPRRDLCLSASPPARRTEVRGALLGAAGRSPGRGPRPRQKRRCRCCPCHAPFPFRPDLGQGRTASRRRAPRPLASHGQPPRVVRKLWAVRLQDDRF